MGKDKNLKPQIKYIFDRGGASAVVELQNGYFAYAKHIFKHNEELFDTPEEALYSAMVKNLQTGTNLSNYKSSPYYDYYVKRLKEEYPEYVI